MSTLTQVVIWGASGHAKVLRSALQALGLQLSAVFDNAEVVNPFTDVPLYLRTDGFQRWRAEHKGEVGGLVAIGGAHGRERLSLQAFLAANGVRLLSITHPRAFVDGTARIGIGSQILAQAVVAAEAQIGEACIVNHSANVDHECELGDGVHLAPGAVLAGCVKVGNHAFVGAGAVILPRIRIGCDAIVGAGSVVTRDVPDGAVVVGSPARVVRMAPKQDTQE